MNLGDHNVVDFDYSKVFHPKIWVYLELGSMNACLEMNQSCSSFLDLDYCRSSLYVQTSQACFAGETLETWERRGSFEIHLAVRNFYRVHQPQKSLEFEVTSWVHYPTIGSVHWTMNQMIEKKIPSLTVAVGSHCQTVCEYDVCEKGAKVLVLL